VSHSAECGPAAAGSLRRQRVQRLATDQPRPEGAGQLTQVTIGERSRLCFQRVELRHDFTEPAQDLRVPEIFEATRREPQRTRASSPASSDLLACRALRESSHSRPHRAADVPSGGDTPLSDQLPLHADVNVFQSAFFRGRPCRLRPMIQGCPARYCSVRFPWSGVEHARSATARDHSRHSRAVAR
jgi:hypothetical protein